jgi:hypothetical protein
VCHKYQLEKNDKKDNKVRLEPQRPFLDKEIVPHYTVVGSYYSRCKALSNSFIQQTGVVLAVGQGREIKVNGVLSVVQAKKIEVPRYQHLKQ